MSEQNQAAVENQQLDQPVETDQQTATEAGAADTGLEVDNTLLGNEEQQVVPDAAPIESEFLGAPAEGYQLEDYANMDDQVRESFSEAAKELNLSESAAKLILDKVAPVLEQREREQVQQMNQEWIEKAQGDQEFGGDKLQENLAVAKQALDAFATPELRDLLQESGLGNHPEVIRFMYRAGKAISQDSFVTGAQGATPQRDLAAFYPNTYK